MTISGGVKFFKFSKSLQLNGSNAVASSGSPSANFALDRNNYTCYRSSGSDDTTTETWTLTLPEATTINRLFLAEHNLKEFTIQYDLSSVWTDFNNVVGIDGSLVAGIDETLFADDTAYYEFSEITTNQIRIQAVKTQVVDQEKFFGEFIVTQELGTLEGFPNIKGVTKDQNIRKKKTLNGRMFVQKSIETKKYAIDFKNYPGGLENDLDLIISLFEGDDSFLVWLCGGRRGTPFFKYQFAGFRLQDIIQMQVTNKFKDSYRKNYYNGTVKMKLTLEET